MRLRSLPGWVVDDDASVRAEVAPYVNASVEELWHHTEDCARDAMWAIRACEIPERALAYEDPVPESTRRALERLSRTRPR